MIIFAVPADQAVYLENQRMGHTYTVRDLSKNRIIAKLYEQAHPYPMPGDAQRTQAQNQAAIVKRLAALAEGLANGNSAAEQMAADLAEQARALVQETGQ
jgi:hypothetical protein